MKRSHLPRATLVVAALLASALAATDADARRRMESETRAYPIEGLQVVRVELPVGEIRVDGSDSDRVRAQVIAHCEHGDEQDCASQARRLTFTGRRTGSTLTLAVDDVPVLDSDGFHAELLVQIPRSLELRVKMNAGEIEAHGVEGHVDVDLRVGEATVRMPERAVRRAAVDVTIGEASIDRRGTWKNHSGLFVRKVGFNDGPGRSRVNVNVGIGEACLRLE